ncbi:hypothetical protein [Streptomyces sp. NPDC014656]|uniref:hypothetical protein n=1 Tax=Streptomyces sp. NPDC014656 TaxID=3364878 RepID=UPI0036F813CF
MKVLPSGVEVYVRLSPGVPKTAYGRSPSAARQAAPPQGGPVVDRAGNDGSPSTSADRSISVPSGA